MLVRRFRCKAALEQGQLVEGRPSACWLVCVGNIQSNVATSSGPL